MYYKPLFKIGGYKGGGDIHCLLSHMCRLSDENLSKNLSASIILKHLNLQKSIYIIF